MRSVLLLSCLLVSALCANVSETEPNPSRDAEESDGAFKNIIDEVNQYIIDERLSLHKLIDFPFNYPFGFLNLKNGKLEDFSTIKLHTSSVKRFENGTLHWSVEFGLDSLSLEVDFEARFFKIFANSGSVKLSVPENHFLLTGTLEKLKRFRKCKTNFEMVTFMNFPDVEVDLEPFSIQNFILEYVLKFVINNAKSIYTPTLNNNLPDFIFDMIPPSKINEILCRNLMF